MRHRRFIALACAAACLCGAAHAAADARLERLTTFAPEELTLVDPLLQGGPVALVGFARGDSLPAITVATYVDAPAAEVADVIAHPEGYSRFMPMLDHVAVDSRRGSQVAYSWRFRVGVFVLEGNNRMHVMAPRPGQDGAPYRVAVYSERGHMGTGRLMWKVHPRGERSLLELSMRVDMREANVIMQQLDAASRSINRSVNLALSYVMALGTRREAERRVGRATAKPPAAAPRRPEVDPEKFRELLGRGDLVWLHTGEHPRSNVWVLGRTGVSLATVRDVMLDPDSFSEGLVPGSHTEVTDRSDAGIEFEWSVGLPLVGAQGRMRMQPQDDGSVLVEATRGSLQGGRFRLATPKVHGWEACVETWAQFDVTSAGFLVRKITEVDPMMGHGLAAATQVMMLRALRIRAWKEARARRAREQSEPAARPSPPESKPAENPAPRRPLPQLPIHPQAR